MDLLAMRIVPFLHRTAGESMLGQELNGLTGTDSVLAYMAIVDGLWSAWLAYSQRG